MKKLKTANEILLEKRRSLQEEADVESTETPLDEKTVKGWGPYKNKKIPFGTKGRFKTQDGYELEGEVWRDYRFSTQGSNKEDYGLWVKGAQARRNWFHMTPVSMTLDESVPDPQ